MNLKSKKGVTLIALTITITVLLMITGITISISNIQLSVKDVNRLYADIDSLDTKVSAYYLEKGELPIYSREYANKATLKNCLRTNGAIGKVINENDEGQYYVLNLSKLDNLTLNFGRKYTLWETNPNTTIENCQDLYIINEVTHQIYYPSGIESNNKVYFTQSN